MLFYDAVLWGCILMLFWWCCFDDAMMLARYVFSANQGTTCNNTSLAGDDELSRFNAITT